MCWDLILRLCGGGGSTEELEFQNKNLLKAPDVTKIGWLFRRNAESLSVWEKFFCVLHHGQLSYYNSEHSGMSEQGKLGDTILIGATCGMKSGVGFEFGITLVCDSETLLFNAKSSADQKEWYDAFLMEIDVANTLALRNQGVVNTGMERWMDQKTTEYNHSLLILQKGYKMKKHYMVMGFHKSHERAIKLDKSAVKLVWYDALRGSAENDADSSELILTDILSINRGADTIALNSLSNKIEDIAKCFSLITSEKSYDFEAGTVNQRNEFLHNLDIVIQYQERIKLSNKNSTSCKQRSNTSDTNSSVTTTTSSISTSKPTTAATSSTSSTRENLRKKIEASGRK